MTDRRFSTTLAPCLVAGVAFFLAEALYLWAAVDTVRLWMAPIHLGVGAPLVVVGALVGGLGLSSWASLIKEGPQPASLSAWILSGVLASGLFVVGVAGAAVTLEDRIATPELAGAATALVALIWLAVLGFGLGILRKAIGWVVEGVAARPRLGFMASPWTWVAAAVGAVVVAIIGGFQVAPEVFSVLPWAYVIAPAAAAVAGVGSYLLWSRRPDQIDKANRGLMAAVVILGLFAFFLPMRLENARQSFVDRPAVASHFKAAVHPFLDFDGDGSLFFYAGGDCAPFDPDRGPNQPEIPNDGIDQNCSGFDLVVDIADFEGGPARVDRPDGIVDRPHVFLITTDALSHPHTTVGGYRHDVTPNLADWASRATVFETAFSNSTSTRLALPGLLLSKMNSQVHLMPGRRHPYDYHPDEVTLGAMLNRQGYRTVHIMGASYFDTRWSGYQHGYQEVDNRAYRRSDHEIHTAPEITEAALDVIHGHDEDRPLHLWIHYFDHHGPYIFPDDGKRFGDGDSNEDRFNSELHFADRHWKKLLGAIEERFEPHEYIIVFTSDHGEAFDANHPREHHDFSVFTRPLHVPLIIQAPWGRGQRIDGLTGHIDVLPTIANLLEGEEPDEDWLGESLIPSLTEGTPPEKAVIYSLFYIPEAARRGERRFQMIGVRTDEWYYFENHRRGERRLVRWREDALDRDDFSRREPEIFETYRYVAQQKLKWLLEREVGLTHMVDDLGSRF